ncbi:MAG: glycoside hydrolase family 5 protein, partial [Clostridia bacterium]|nr:glycoside hydrolase family 5 protein [Clostridia bacterium]
MKTIFRILCLTLVLLLTGACATTPSGTASESASKSFSGGAASSKGALGWDDISLPDSGDESQETAQSETAASSGSGAASSSATSSKTSSKTSSASSSKATSSTATVAKLVLPFKRGINLQGLDGAEYSTWGNTAYLGKDSTYTNIKNRGFDHVRFPVDLRRYYDSSTKTLKSNISNVDMILDKIEAAGLYCLLDFHGWYNLNTSDATQKDTFLTIWKLVAERYKNRSDKLVFELINEPHDTEGGNLNYVNLNALQNEVIPIIRQTNPTRIILAAAAEWNGPWKLNVLTLPTDDGHIGVVCHTYAPMDFTHQGAPWAGMSGDQVH